MGERGLIRLVTQFDPPTARPAYATPSCSSSCCCCCCVGTAVASLSFTAVNAYSVAAKEERRVGARWAAGILGGLALPAALALAYLLGSLGGVLIWPVVVLAAYLVAQRDLLAAIERTILIVVVALLAALLELIVAAGFLSTAGLIFELIVGLVVVAAGFRFARRW